MQREVRQRQSLKNQNTVSCHASGGKTSTSTSIESKGAGREDLPPAVWVEPAGSRPSSTFNSARSFATAAASDVDAGERLRGVAPTERATVGRGNAGMVTRRGGEREAEAILDAIFDEVLSLRSLF